MPAEGGHDRRMGVLKVLGQVFVALGAAMLGIGAWLRFAGHDLTMPAGQLWFTVDKASLNLTQAIIQRYVSAGLWDSVMVPLLLLPGWKAIGLLFLICGAIGGLLLIVAARRRRRGYRR
jgi:hypothetical protein